MIPDLEQVKEEYYLQVEHDMEMLKSDRDITPAMLEDLKQKVHLASSPPITAPVKETAKAILQQGDIAQKYKEKLSGLKDNDPESSSAPLSNEI